MQQIKRRLPAGTVDRLRAARGGVRLRLQSAQQAPVWVLRVCSRWRWASRLYYALFSGAFAREQQGVLYGRLRFLESGQGPDHNESLLRRNVHRLEKGLIMRPRRPVFATDYIEDTVEAFVRRSDAARCGAGLVDPEGLEWAEDVLSSYFEAVGTHPLVDRARGHFAGARLERVSREQVKAPFRRDLEAPSPVRFEDLHRLSLRRRSVRWFLPRPVERELIDQALLVAAQSPTACNRQPYEFRIFDDPEMVSQVAALPGGSKGFRQNFPVIVTVVGRQRAYFSERDRHVIYIDASLAAMSFVLALETLGLSSCIINWPDVEHQEARMTRLLHLEPDERPVMQIAVGYPDPDALVPYSGKKSLDTLRRYNVL
jgi:nitroreductase